MAYRRKSKTTSDGVKRTSTVTDGAGKTKAGFRNTVSKQTGKGSGYSKRTTWSRGQDGRMRTTTTTKHGGWITRETFTDPKPKKLKKQKRARKGTFARKVQDGTQAFMIGLIAVIVFVALLQEFF